MTVIDAAPAPTVDDVVARIKDNVWTLVRAGQLPAAVVLMESVVEDFDRASMRDFRDALGIPEPARVLALPGPEVVTASDITTSDQPPELDVVPAVGDATAIGTMVYVVTDTKAISQPPRVRTPVGVGTAS